jgi:hypothetical protein
MGCHGPYLRHRLCVKHTCALPTCYCVWADAALLWRTTQGLFTQYTLPVTCRSPVPCRSPFTPHYPPEDSRTVWTHVRMFCSSTHTSVYQPIRSVELYFPHINILFHNCRLFFICGLALTYDSFRCYEFPKLSLRDKNVFRVLKFLFKHFFMSMVWWSELRPPTGLLFVIQIHECGEPEWNDTGKEKAEEFKWKTCPNVTLATTNLTWIDWAQTAVSAVRVRRLTAWATAI